MNIGIFGSEYQKEEQIRNILNILYDNNADIFIHEDFNLYLQSTFQINLNQCKIIDKDFFRTKTLDIAISIGGDGTFLRTSKIVAKYGIPILGVNTGRLGFLADINEDSISETLQDIMTGKYNIEQRALLQLDGNCELFGNACFALNEIAVLKQDTASMITVHASINGEYLTSYDADGLIISAPPGSTAYSLSAGGPIMAPRSGSFIMVAVAAHSLNNRPLVVPDNSIITLQVECRSGNFLLSLDERSEALPSGTELTIRKADFQQGVVKREGHTFYKTLRKKLMWGADPRNKRE